MCIEFAFNGQWWIEWELIYLKFKLITMSENQWLSASPIKKSPKIISFFRKWKNNFKGKAPTITYVYFFRLPKEKQNPSRDHGSMSFVRRFICPKVQLSEGSSVRRFICPKAHLSEGSSVRRFIWTQTYCFEGYFIFVINCNLRTSDPSDIWTFGQINIRTDEPPDKWTVTSVMITRQSCSLMRELFILSYV